MFGIAGTFQVKQMTTHARSRHTGIVLSRLLVVAVTASLAVSNAVGGALASPARQQASGSTGWTAYLNGTLHQSNAPLQRTITSKNVPHIVTRWRDFPQTAFVASPTVADGAVFIGSETGWFYKLSATTGAVLHRYFIGSQPKKTCPAQGVVSTAAVAENPATHQSTVYVGGPNGYLYALRASNLSLEWRSVVAIPSSKTSNYFNYSSPSIANGTIYVGVSSNCDIPLIRGGVIAYNQANGKKIAQFYSVPKGDIGGSVWSSLAIMPGGDVFATTGNGPETSAASRRIGYSESIIKFAPRTLRVLGRFQVPAAQATFDGDFGASPVIDGKDVGACDKNGLFYMLSQATMKVVWEGRVGDTTRGFDACIAAGALAGGKLYLAGSGATIAGVKYAGDVQERDAATGRLVWRQGLAGEVFGSPAVDGGGVVSVPVFSGAANVPSMYLVDAEFGGVLRTLLGGKDFAQGVFADNMLFTANATGVYAWQPS